MNVVEEEMDKTIKSIKDIIDTMESHEKKIETVEENVKDSVDLMTKLDGRMVS